MCVEIPEGALFYGETRRREEVSFSESLRNQVRNCLMEMHGYFSRGYTPKVKPSKSCNACSLKDLCLPRLMKTKTVDRYIRDALKEEQDAD